MENSKDKTLFSVAVYLSLLLSACIGGFLAGQAGFDILTRAGYMVVLGAVFLMALFWDKEFIWNQITVKKIYMAAFVLSALLTSVSSQYSVGSYWMLLLIVAVYIGKFHLIVVSYGVLMISYVIQALNGQGAGRLAYYLIMGIAIILVLSMIQSWKEIPYAAVILLALSTALQILLYRFDLQAIWEARYSWILEILGVLFFVLVWMMLHILFPVEVSAQDGDTGQDGKEELLLYLEDGFPLLEELKKQKDLYHHSCEISKVSNLAARRLGLDAALCAAGGMFHEIGRIRTGEDYMANSIRLADEYHFSDRLTAILRQHNAGYEIPKSPEAAVVMLSDNIISTSEYLAKSGKRSMISDETLVNGIFNNRMAKGNLNESGLSQEQLEELKAFFVEIERHGYQNDDTDRLENR